MDKTIIRRIGCAILAVLMLTLCGCGLIRQTKETVDAARAEMDELLVQLMTCVENNDVEGAAALAYDSDRMRSDFSALRESWPACGSDFFELKDLNIDQNIAGPENSGKTVEAAYQVQSGGEVYKVVLVKKKDANGDGLYSVNANRLQNAEVFETEPITGNGPVPRKSFGQWCFTGFWILCCGFSAFTIFDIIRKKPKLYGLWILVALVFAGFHTFSGNNSFQIGFDIGLLNRSEWIRYYGGANFFQICVPLGAILYWCLRRTLLQRKVRYAVPADQPPSEP